MSPTNNLDVIKPDLIVTEGNADGEPRMALVMSAPKDTTLGAIVELLVDHWDLPVWEDEPIAYDLYHSSGSSAIDLSQTLTQLNDKSQNDLFLTPASNRLVMVQAVADVMIFDIRYDEKQKIVSILSLPEEITVNELRDKLEELWSLPTFPYVDEPMHYRVGFTSGELLPNKFLIELAVEDRCELLLTRMDGFELFELGEGDTDEEEAISENLIDITTADEMTTKEKLDVNRKERDHREATHRKSVTGQMEQVESSERELSRVKPIVSISDERHFRKSLIEAINDSLNMPEMEEIFFILDVDMDEFSGNTKKSLIIGLLQYWRRHHDNDLSELLKELFKIAPRIRNKLVANGFKAWLPS